MEEEKYYIGTDLKFKLEITASGFDQGTDEYTIDLYSGSKRITVTQDQIIDDGDGFYLLVPTSQLKPGVLKMVVTAKVPDGDFPSGYRNEVTVQNLAYLKGVN